MMFVLSTVMHCAGVSVWQWNMRQLPGADTARLPEDGHCQHRLRQCLLHSNSKPFAQRLSLHESHLTCNVCQNVKHPAQTASLAGFKHLFMPSFGSCFPGGKDAQRALAQSVTPLLHCDLCMWAHQSPIRLFQAARVSAAACKACLALSEIHPCLLQSLCRSTNPATVRCAADMQLLSKHHRTLCIIRFVWHCDQSPVQVLVLLQPPHMLSPGVQLLGRHY